MCLIIDSNVAHYLIQLPLSDDAILVVDWIERGAGRVVFGGKLTDELVKNNSVGRWLRGLAQAGRAAQIARHDIESEEARLIREGNCVSNDHHIVALARLAGARLLYSNDQNLHADFRNPNLLNRPRGCVYQNRNHRHLLNDSVCRA